MAQAIRILVPVKRVVDYTIRPRVAKDGISLATSVLKHSMNPFDELSVEEAVRIRERGKIPVQEIVAVSIGSAKSVDTLRTALAMGADKAVHVDVGANANAKDNQPELEPLAVAKVLRKVAIQHKSDLILLGKQAIDSDAGQTAGMLAGLLDWPQVTQAAQIELGSQPQQQQQQQQESSSPSITITVTREVDGGTEKIQSRLPAVVSVDLRLNQPRYASLPNIMKAKKKPVIKTTVADFLDDAHHRLATISVAEPEKRKAGKIVKDVDEFVDELKRLQAI